jgi:imidazolonepropionase-like amidohydrolase
MRNCTLRAASAAAALLGLAAAPSAAAGAGAAPASCAVLVGARTFLPEGFRDDAVVVVDAGRILSAGAAPKGLGTPDAARARVPWGSRDCAWLDLRGAWLVPAFVDASTSLGVVEVGLEDGSRDDDSDDPDPIRASLRIADAYNPRSTVIPVSRLEGIGTALVWPQGGLVAGQIAWVQLRSGTQAESVLAPSVALLGSLGASPSVARSLQMLRELLDDGRSFARDRDGWEQRPRPDSAATSADLVALQPLLKGELPLVVAADRASDIEALLRFADAEKIRIVVDGGAEAWMLAPELARRRVAVMVDPLVVGPGSWGEIHARADNAALLHAADVPVVIASHSAHFARTLRQKAGNAVRGGLPWEAALRAVTETPARVFGLRETGRIVPGARADLAAWSGDPLEIGSRLLRLLIGGEDVRLESRQTLLFQRYRNLP